MVKENSSIKNIYKNYTFVNNLLDGIYFIIYWSFKSLSSTIRDYFRYITTIFFIRCKTYVRLYEGVTIWYPHRLNIGNKVTLNEWYILVTLAVYQWEMTAQEVIEFQQYNPIMA